MVQDTLNNVRRPLTIGSQGAGGAAFAFGYGR